MATKKCPYCVEDIESEAKTCPFCKSVVVKPCPACAEPIHVMAKICRFCGTSVQGGAPAAGRPLPSKALPDRPIGEKREIVMQIVLVIVTCGIWAFVWWFKIGDEINRHRSRNDLNPGLDILLIFVTCGIWMPFMAYRYAKAIEEIQAEEGLPVKDQAVVVALLGFFLPIVAKILLQDELNKHWDLHTGPAA